MQKGITQHKDGTETLWAANFLDDKFVDGFAQTYENGDEIGEIYEITREDWLQLATKSTIDGLRNLKTFTERTGIPLGDDVVTKDGIQSLDVFGALAIDLGLTTVEWIEEVGPYNQQMAYYCYRGPIKRLPNMTFEPVYGTSLFWQLLNTWRENHNVSEIADMYESEVLPLLAL